ncbi:hypothetical protein FD755_025486 [Muntiacus reevesi]|uniref:Uncharacterized protein n=1 Tax=Muntiacus reevesi TaxID=9886 RepID=A0A5N3UM64_MUNRE|nr:hypothetical protein FD755_025486 [Muntiacus reevesi]
MAGRGKLMAVMGDEDTMTGFLLGGIGVLNKNCHPNFLVMDFLGGSDSKSICLQCGRPRFTSLTSTLQRWCRHALDALWHCIPAILEIPSKEHLCDAANVSILRRARGMFMAENLH